VAAPEAAQLVRASQLIDQVDVIDIGPPQLIAETNVKLNIGFSVLALDVCPERLIRGVYPSPSGC
jgi:hypothetical protein